MVILPKQYLSLVDIANYFNAVSNSTSYDLSKPDDLTRLYSDVYDLFIENKINIVFHYTGNIRETECDNVIDEHTGKLANCKTTTTYYSSAYFSLSTIVAREILLERATMPRQTAFNLYCLSNGEKRDDTSEKIYLHEMLDNYFGNITIQDLRIPLADIENLFSINKTKSQPNSKANQCDDNKPIHHKSKATVKKILYALAELSEKDNSSPYSQNKGSLNEAITTILQNAGIPLEYEAVGNWLSEIKDISPPNKN